jgi:deoxyribonuclease IV
MLLGAHVSIAGGLFNAPTRGKEIGCSAIQIFTKNQRQWKHSPLTEEQIEQYKNELTKSCIEIVIAHDSYLINLCSPDKNNLHKSRESFIFELARCQALGISGLVFHPGAHLILGEKKGLSLIAESINIVLEKFPEIDTKLLLETTAGQGTSLGYRFEQLEQIIQKIEAKDKVGVCFDTCHIFASGYDIRTAESYQVTFKKFEDIIGLDKLGVFHLNDSKKELGSRVDRHERIGEGKIGLEAFRLIMNDLRFKNVPKILEIPGGENCYKQDIALLNSLVKN